MSIEQKQSSLKTIGVKGVFLEDMMQAGILVPSGFIMTMAYEKFMEVTRLYAQIDSIIEQEQTSLNDMNSILQTSNRIIGAINSTQLPESLKEGLFNEFAKLKSEYVSIRPSLLVDDSSSVSLVREFTAYLNIPKSGLVETIKDVWISSFSPASIAYRLKNNIDIKEPLVVILIQKMIDAETSGVSFTSHPITQDKNQIVIEASLGLSEGSNVKRIARDTYVVNKNNWKILGKTIFPQKKMLARVASSTKEVEVAVLMSERQKLTNAQILSLANLTKKIEDFYKGAPQRIEWVFEKNNFYIIQAQGIDKA